MNKESTKLALMTGGMALLLVGLQLVRAKADGGARTDIDGAIEALRSDACADKMEIVGKVMDLEPDQAQKFWPIYRDFDAELTKLNDERAALIRAYAKKNGVLGNREARAMADQTFDLQHRRADLNRRTFDRLAEEIPAATAAKFLQLENRLDLVTDARMAYQLPPAVGQPSPRVQQ